MKKVIKSIYIVPVAIILAVVLIYFLCFEVMAASLTKVTSSTLLDADYGWSFKFISGTTTVTYGGMTNYAADYKKTDGSFDSTKYVTARLTSTSQKGNIWIRYNNVGTYNGQIIDLKITLVDWSYLQPANTSANSSIGGVNYPTVFFNLTRIGIDNTSVPAISSPKYTYTFYEHGTDTTISLKGHFTFQDMDGSTNGGNEYFIPSSGLTAYYVTSDTSISTSSTKVINNTSTSTATSDTNGWVTCFFNGSSFSFIYSKLNSEKGNSYRDVTATASSTSRTNYAFVTSANSVAPFEFSDLEKSTSQEDIKEGDEFTYTLNQYIPGEASTYYYTSWVLIDTIPSCFEIESIVVTDDSTTRTSWFTITTDDNVVTVTANSSTLTNSNFYNNNINIAIKVKLKSGCDLSSYYSGGTFAIPNTASVTISSPKISGTRTETLTSNTVNEKVYYDVTTSVNGSGGTITGDESVYYGDDSTENYIVITADEGYYIKSVTINGEVQQIGSYLTTLTLDNFEFMTEDKEVVVEFELFEYTLTVEWYDETNDVLLNTKTSSVKYWDTYDTSIIDSELDLSNYDLSQIDGDTSGIIKGDVTVVYYYTLKEATLTVHHYIVDTQTKLDDDEVSTVYYTKTYNTSPSSDIDSDYELVETPSNATGVVDTDSIEVTYYYKLKDATLVVHHYIENTTTSLTPDEEYSMKYKDDYTTTSQTYTNYELVETPSNATGIISSDVVEVTYYYKLKEATLTVHHYIVNTQTKLADDEVSTVYYGNSYSTSISSNIAKNYKYVSKSSNYEGTVASDTIEVTYYYEKIDSTISSTIEKEGTEEINSVDSSVTYTITYNAKISDYIGKGYVVIKDTLPYKIDETTSNLNGGTYDELTQTITWEYELETTSIEEYEYNKTIEITLYYLDIDPTSRSMNNNVTSTITLDNNSETSSDSFLTNIKISGNIITHYYLKGTTTSIKDDLKVSGLVGETYTSESVEITGYNLVEEPTEKTITYIDGTIEIAYYYERIAFTITTSVDGVGGTIVGDESVYYGDNSTENYIVITADEGYVIDTVKVNGEQISINSNLNSLILDYFTNVLENKNIVVTFKIVPVTLTVKYYSLDEKITSGYKSLGWYIEEYDYWDSYTTKEDFPEIDLYDFSYVEGKTSGVMQGDVTVIYYYTLKEATITTHYLEEGTDEELASDDVQTVKYTYSYETISSGNVPENYELVSKSSNYKGYVYSDKIDVYYYYRVMDSTLSSTIEKEGTEEINSVDSSVTYTITYNAKISDYIGKGYVVIKDTLPYKIDETTSDLNGGTYDDVTQTITWEYELETTSIEEYEYNKTIEITLYYLDIDPTRRSMNNNVSSTITLDNNSDTIETNCVTNVLISGNIIVHYIDKDTDTSLIDDLEVSGLVGETYTSESVEITGYNLVEEPSETTITYEDGDIEITYYYEKIKYNITTSVNGNGGTIKGNEVISYGDDSTENYIVITADEGYYIKSVTINGEAIEIESELTTLTLDYFQYVTEDFNIEVEFEEIPIVIEVPNTSLAEINIYLIISLLIMGLFIVNRTYKINN